MKRQSSASTAVAATRGAEMASTPDDDGVPGPVQEDATNSLPADALPIAEQPETQPQAAKGGAGADDDGPKELETANSPYFYWNLSWLALIIIGIFWWTMAFSHFFSSAKPFALTVVLAAMSFVWSWLPKGLKDSIVEAVQRLMFTSALVASLLPWLFGSLFVFSSCWSTIELRPSSEAYEVTVARDGAKSGAKLKLPGSGQSLRLVRFLPFRSNKYTISVAGHPSIKIRLAPWQREVVRVDQAFQRPTLLVLPTKALTDFIGSNAKTLVVTVNEDVYKHAGYKGEAFWIGAEKGVEVPAWLKERWWQGYPEILPAGQTLTEEILRKTIHHWSRAGVPTEFPPELPPRAKVTVELFNDTEDGGGRYTGFGPISVRLPLRKHEFPQTEMLDVGS